MNFRQKVYGIVKSIPIGKVATYGQVAKLAGKPKGARAVGLFMKQNPDIPNTPCHRVVAGDGGLRGYAGEGGLRRKMEMLKEEGVEFVGDKVDLKSSIWIGTEK